MPGTQPRSQRPLAVTPRPLDFGLTHLPQVDLPVGTHVIGDCHLDVESTRDSGALEHFLAWLGAQSDMSALVILGDLFEVWRGRNSLSRPAASRVCEQLGEQVRRGTALHVLHGNRDFLLGPEFAMASGARLWPTGLIGRLGSSAARGVLLLHGDELCTLDFGYQRLKRTVRQPFVRAAARALPDFASRALAKRLRGAAVRSLAAKPRPEVEQQASEAARLLTRHACQLAVVGHAHRFQDRELELDQGARARWIVLDAFGAGQDVARLMGPSEVHMERSLHRTTQDVSSAPRAGPRPLP